MKESQYYVGIKDPAGMRRTLLYSSKDLIDSLRSFQGFKDIRARKQELIAEFKIVVEEITVLNRRLKTKLPKGYVKASRKGKSKPSSPIDVLEKELVKVESELKRLE